MDPARAVIAHKLTKRIRLMREQMAAAIAYGRLATYDRLSREAWKIEERLIQVKYHGGV